MLKDIFENSYKSFPKESINLDDLHIDESIFFIDGKYEATFFKPLPTKIIDQLADEAEKTYCESNSVETSKGYHNAFFYKYLSTYQQIAAQNLNIDNLTKNNAISYITEKLINTDYLARVITYFDLVKNQKPSFSQIVKFYKDQAYPEAKKLLSEKFNINFQIPESIEDSLFLGKTHFQ